MSLIKGQKQAQKFKRGESLTRREAILAMCYICSGGSRKDCGDAACPLHQWHPAFLMANTPKPSV